MRAMLTIVDRATVRERHWERAELILLVAVVVVLGLWNLLM